MTQRATPTQPPLDLIAGIQFGFCLTVTIFGLAAMAVMVVASVIGLDDSPTRLVMLRASLFLLGWVFLSTLRRRQHINRITNLIIFLIAVSSFTASTEIMFTVFGFAAISLAAMLGSPGLYGLTIALFAARIVMFQQEGDANLVTESSFTTGMVFVSVVVLSWLIHRANQQIRHAAVASRRSTELLQATAEIGQATFQLLDLNELFSRAVDLIRNRLGFYHVQIFLVDDERQYAALVASTGAVGRLLIKRGHKLAVGSQSVIGQVTLTNQVVVARDTDIDKVHARNELLPNTRSEMALPITDGKQIIGALDVQSVHRNAFDPIDIQALQTLTNQLAVSIRNARSFAAQAASLAENKRLYLESEANLREIQRLNRQLTGQVWEEYLAGQRSSIGVAIDEKGAVTSSDWSPGMIEAGQKQRPIVAEENQKTIAVPILLRGEVIGAIEVEPSAGTRAQDAAEMIRAIAGNLAVSLDNARLFEEVQEDTFHEQRINEIVQRYQTADTVDDLLQITLAELGATLGAQRSRIRLVSAKKSRDLTVNKDDHSKQAGDGHDS